MAFEQKNIYTLKKIILLMVKKKYVSADSLYEDSFRLAKNIYDSGFRPGVVLAIWRGGAPVGVIIQEFLEYKKVGNMHAVVKASSYHGRSRSEKVNVYGLKAILKTAKKLKHKKILLIDDVFDTGNTLKTILSIIPKSFEVKTATPYFKPKNNRTNILPDFWVHKTESWIVFPHNLVELTDEEIKRKNPKLYNIIKGK